ncbi:hypothetical protein PAHAL_9G235900 [Panicum hallii]|uniref:Myb-like domain-containing protein n=1 Tax=Panicum hallii TaxID=206008 RepID=A0A2S3IMC9_9POAL|nr:hypothetical protein PAHAL_9G235900 [Panicum hallii]
MEDHRMGIQLLMTGPPNEANLYEILVGYARNGDGAEAVQKIHTDHEMGDYLEPSMLGCFSSPWRCGRRGTRMRSRSSWRVKCVSVTIVNVILSYELYARIGKWSRVQDDYFSTSVHTAIHLKDKWRNLVAACKANTSRKARKEKNTSTKKVSVQKTTELVVKRFGHRILAMEAKHVVQKKK